MLRIIALQVGMKCFLFEKSQSKELRLNILDVKAALFTHSPHPGTYVLANLLPWWRKKTLVDSPISCDLAFVLLWPTTSIHTGYPI